MNRRSFINILTLSATGLIFAKTLNGCLPTEGDVVMDITKVYSPTFKLTLQRGKDAYEGVFITQTRKGTLREIYNKYQEKYHIIVYVKPDGSIEYESKLTDNNSMYYVRVCLVSKDYKILDIDYE